jgi:hypothetical protein
MAFLITVAFSQVSHGGFGQKMITAKVVPEVIDKLNAIEPLITKVIQADIGKSIDDKKPIKNLADAQARYNSESDTTQKIKNLLTIGEFSLLKLQAMEVVAARIIQALEELKALASAPEQTQLDGIIELLKKGMHFTEINTAVRELERLRTQVLFEVVQE